MRLTFICFFMAVFYIQAQDSTKHMASPEVKPAIGGTGSSVKPTVSVMFFHPLNHRFSMVSHSLFSFLLFRNYPQEYIKTHYNFSFSQKLGLGYSLYGKQGKGRHTLLALGGIRHVVFKETMDNPELDKVTVSTHNTVPDYGLMYEFSLGTGRYTFDTRLYLPLSPIRYYPLGTLTNLAYLEMGVGIKLYPVKKNN